MAQTGNWMHKLIVTSTIALLFLGCNPNRHVPEVVELNPAPHFNSDSAFAFIQNQLAFGPRTHGAEGHTACGDYLVDKLQSYGFEVNQQIDTVIGYDNQRFRLRNIIGSLNLKNENRVLLSAHWDSRPFADQDTANQHSPIVGANDNASGVAVLLELARCFRLQDPNVGVDVVLFDLEDHGRPAFEEGADYNDHGYCLGSKYWAESIGNYTANYGVVVDMVGAKDAIFTLESGSMEHAESIVYKVWDMGHQLGFGKHFQYNRTLPVFDDHKNINEIAQIPTIDIIQHDATTESRFGKFWHTHQDNINIIDRSTLTAVGQTLIHVIYNEGEE